MWGCLWNPSICIGYIQQLYCTSNVKHKHPALLLYWMNPHSKLRSPPFTSTPAGFDLQSNPGNDSSNLPSSDSLVTEVHSPIKLNYHRLEDHSELWP